MLNLRILASGLKNSGPLRVSSLLTDSWNHRRYAAQIPELDKRVVVLTGCDSGLGYSFAVECSKRKLKVIAGCLCEESEGGEKLKLIKDVSVRHLDVRSSSNVQQFRDYVREYLTQNPQIKLQAVVNNAGVMIFGEFEWLTDEQVLQQIQVNQIGTFRVAKSFLSLLRKHQGRLINISSHCALVNLPGLSVYGSTKAAINGWSNGLRMEQKKYGVKVISFIPGSFVMQSNILQSQAEHARKMEADMMEETRQFYGEYFSLYNSYLAGLSTQKPVTVIDDKCLYEKFFSAVLDEKPRSHYIHGPSRYHIYHLLFKITPEWLRDKLIQKFMAMPVWRPKNQA